MACAQFFFLILFSFILFHSFLFILFYSFFFPFFPFSFSLCSLRYMAFSLVMGGYFPNSFWTSGAYQTASWPTVVVFLTIWGKVACAIVAFSSFFLEPSVACIGLLSLAHALSRSVQVTLSQYVSIWLFAEAACIFCGLRSSSPKQMTKKGKERQRETAREAAKAPDSEAMLLHNKENLVPP
jgi:hypothetical protein